MKITCGDIVVLKIGTIKGMITAILKRFDRIQYELTYVYNGEIRATWITEEEIEIKEEKSQIGFNK